MDGGGLTDDNDDGGAKWSRGAPTREVAGLDGLTIGARRRGGRDWIPARQRPDAVVAVASRLGGIASRERVGETLPASRVVDSYRGEKEGNLAEILGWVGCQSTQKLAWGRMARGKRWDPSGKAGCQSRPY